MLYAQRGNLLDTARWFQKQTGHKDKEIAASQKMNELIEKGIGKEFNFTKERFKEWVLVPLQYERDYGSYIIEALEYASLKS